MVWDPPRQEVNVSRMMIYSIFPFIAIYAGWRIQKFWVIGAIQLLVIFGLLLPLDIFLFPQMGSLISLPLSIILSICIVRHYAIKYNEKIKDSNYKVQ